MFIVWRIAVKKRLKLEEIELASFVTKIKDDKRKLVKGGMEALIDTSCGIPDCPCQD